MFHSINDLNFLSAKLRFLIWKNNFLTQKYFLFILSFVGILLCVVTSPMSLFHTFSKIFSMKTEKMWMLKLSSFTGNFLLVQILYETWKWRCFWYDFIDYIQKWKYNSRLRQNSKNLSLPKFWISYFKLLMKFCVKQINCQEL